MNCGCIVAALTFHNGSYTLFVNTFYVVWVNEVVPFWGGGVTADECVANHPHPLDGRDIMAVNNFPVIV